MDLTWLDAKTNAWNGHNVCVICWQDGTFSYVDYSSPSAPVSSYSDICSQVISDYGGNTCVGWSLWTRDLSRLELHWK